MINWHKVIEFLLAPAAGLFGGLTVLRHHRDVITAVDVFWFLFTSICCATFLTGLIAEHLKLSFTASGGIGYLLGLFGGSLISAIIKWLRTVDITDLIERFFKKGG